MLSGLSVAELAQAVTLQESGRLTKVPGIGKKTAERILLELKDKLGAELTTAVGVHRPAPASSDILNALLTLGYSDKEAVAAVRAAARRRRGRRRHPAGAEAAGQGLSAMSSTRQGLLRDVKLPPGVFRRGINLWPPFLGAGVRVTRVAGDYREIDVTLKLGLLNRNYFGTQFGGSMFAMTDPFFALMMLRNLGPEYVVWDRAGAIRYLKPGRGDVYARFRLAAAAVARARAATTRGRKHEPTFTVAIVDGDGATIAEVDKTLYVRRRPETPKPARKPAPKAAPQAPAKSASRRPAQA